MYAEKLKTGCEKLSALAFYIKNAIFGLKSNKLLNIIVIVSVAVGMMYPVIACTIVDRILFDAKLNEYQDIERTTVLEFFAPYMEQSEIDGRIKALSEDIDGFGYQAIYTVTARWKKHTMVTNVGGYSSGYLLLEGNKLDKGRLITEEEMSEGSPVCLVSTNGNNAYKTGGSISFMGTSYRIVGIIYMPKSYAGVLIPYKAMEKFVGRNNIQYKVTIHTKQKPDINELTGKLDFASSVLTAGTAEENVKPYLESVWTHIKDRIGIGLIVLLFAVISITMIIIGKTMDEQYVLGVKMSVGATGSRVFFETFLQNSILMIIALLLDFLLFPVAKHYYRIIRSYPDIRIFIVMSIVSLIIAFFVSFLGTAAVLKNKSISGLLKKLK